MLRLRHRRIERQRTVKTFTRHPASRASVRLPEDRHWSGAGWFALTATAFAGVAPLVLMRSTPTGEASSPAWVLAWGLSIALGLRYAWLVAEGRRRLFELVFWLFTYVFLALAPLVQMRSGVYPVTTPYIDVRLNGLSMAAIAVGAGAFSVGVTLAARPPRQSPRKPELQVLPARVALLSWGALLFGAYYLSQVGVATMFTSRDIRSQAQAAIWTSPPISAVVAAMATLPLVVAFVALLALRRQRLRDGVNGPHLLLFLVVVALILLLNPLTNPRYLAGTAGLSVLVAIGAVATQRRMRTFGLLLAVGLVFVFPYADIARYAGQSGSGKEGGPAQVLSSPDFDAFDQVNNTLAYMQDAEPPIGRQLAGAVLFFVPRSAWPTKPDDTGALLADYRGYSVSNLSAPLVAEALINGGWPGLIGSMAGLGFVLRRWDDAVDGARPWSVSPGVLAATLPFYGVIMLRGSLLQSMAGFTVLVACGLFVSSRSRPCP